MAPTNRDCPSDNDLAAFAEGQLASDHSELVASHLAGCVRCSALIQARDTAVARRLEVTADAEIRPTETFTPATASPSDLFSAEHESAEADTHPQVISRYIVKTLLGEGGFGRVYLATDTQLDRRVAVKIPKTDLVKTPEHAAPYIKEARTVAKLDHPNIVPVYDSGSTAQNAVFIVSKFIDGVSLLQWQPPSDCPFHEEIARIIAKVAGALNYAHLQGLVHRDVKPSNILIDRSGEPFIVDFGVALHENEMGQGSVYAGTLAYMSPEQAEGKSHEVDGRSDIFNLGVVMYELLVGKRPFAGETRRDLVHQITSCEARPLRVTNPKVPAELERVCLKALEKKVSDRYTTAGDLADDLQHWLAGASPSTATRSTLKVVMYMMPVLLLAVVASLAWPNPSSDLVRPMTVDRLEGTIEAIIWNRDDEQRQGRRLTDRETLPLRSGDYIRIEATLSLPSYAYIVWIDTAGDAFPVYPWKDGDWSNRPELEIPASLIRLPDSLDGFWPLKAASGMETLVLLARATPLPPEVDLEQLFSGFPGTGVYDPRALVWFRNGAVIEHNRDALRAPQFFGVERIDDPLIRTQRLIQTRLGPHFGTIQAASFASLVES